MGTSSKASALKTGAFMVIDVDHFKPVNDTYGHIAGDRVLKACANALRKVLRDSDIIGRQGGDEFVVFCQGINDSALAEKRAIQIRKAWKKLSFKGGARHITASIGIALAPYHGTSFRELYGNADEAMYKAKALGRDCQVLFTL